MKKFLIILAILLSVSLCGCVDDEVSVQADTDISTNLKTTELESKAEVVCTVSFDSLGGTAVEQQTVIKGEKAAEPLAPTKECKCEFDGWYLGEEKWSFIGYSVTEDITLTAKWIECYGLNDKEFEIINNLSFFKGKYQWQDVANIQRNGPDCYANDFYSNYVLDENTLEYQITFKDGKTEFLYLQKEYVEN